MEFLQTTLCYLEKDGAYLMLHRIKKKNDVNHDKWVGVGGKFEPGEDALACALREVREETGLTMRTPQYRGIVDFYCAPWPAERMHLYTCTDFCGEMTDCDEAVWNGWTRPPCRTCRSGRGTRSLSSCWQRTNRFFIWS